MPNPTPWYVVTDGETTAIIDAVGAVVQEDTDLEQKATYEEIAAANNGAEVPAVYPPIGALHDFAGTTAPEGWLFCDGAAISRVDYSALFAVIGITFGAGDGFLTFNLPDCRDRFVRGKSGTVDLGDTGGTTSLTHAGAAVDNHTDSLTHSGTAVGNHTAHSTTTIDYAGPGTIQTVVTSGTHTSHSVTQPSAHSLNLAHAVTQPDAHTGVEPPYLALNQIIRYAG